MDNRVYILPVLSAVIVASIILARPQITGFSVAGGVVAGPKILDAQIRVSVGEGMIPEGSIVTVTLANRTASMNISDFIGKSGEAFSRVYGSIGEIGYEGYGYEGPAEYTVGLDQFGLDLVLQPGNYTLSNSISYQDLLLSYTEENVEIG